MKKLILGLITIIGITFYCKSQSHPTLKKLKKIQKHSLNGIYRGSDDTTEFIILDNKYEQLDIILKNDAIYSYEDSARSCNKTQISSYDDALDFIVNVYLYIEKSNILNDYIIKIVRCNDDEVFFEIVHCDTMYYRDGIPVIFPVVHSFQTFADTTLDTHDRTMMMKEVIRHLSMICMYQTRDEEKRKLLEDCDMFGGYMNSSLYSKEGLKNILYVVKDSTEINVRDYQYKCNEDKYVIADDEVIYNYIITNDSLNGIIRVSAYSYEAMLYKDTMYNVYFTVISRETLLSCSFKNKEHEYDPWYYDEIKYINKFQGIKLKDIFKFEAYERVEK